MINAAKPLWFIIDDDLDDQEIFTFATEKVNTSVVCTFARDGVEALEKIEEDLSFLPQCIFLDVNMPRMNGIECLIELRKIERLNSIPIFMCSTSADPRIIAQTKALGAADFIVKPATIADFSKILADVQGSLA
jgi:CheY-like chemotaxis protein